MTKTAAYTAISGDILLDADTQRWYLLVRVLIGDGDSAMTYELAHGHDHRATDGKGLTGNGLHASRCEVHG